MAPFLSRDQSTQHTSSSLDTKEVTIVRLAGSRFLHHYTIACVRQEFYLPTVGLYQKGGAQENGPKCAGRDPCPMLDLSIPHQGGLPPFPALLFTGRVVTSSIPQPGPRLAWLAPKEEHESSEDGF